MSHQWDGVNMIAGMGIPEAVQTMGGLYFWKQDREVPDQWHVMLEYPKQELNVTFACTFHNRHHGTNTYFFGRDATLEVHTDWCRVFGSEWKPDYGKKIAAARKAATAADWRFTVKGPVLFATALSWPGAEAIITSLGSGKAPGKITSVKLLGHHGTLRFTQVEGGVKVQLPSEKLCNYAFVLKIVGLDGANAPSPGSIGTSQ